MIMQQQSYAIRGMPAMEKDGAKKDQTYLLHLAVRAVMRGLIIRQMMSQKDSFIFTVL